MLDILGNVFGRSKKQTNSTTNVTNNGPNGDPNEGFIVVGQQTNESTEEQTLYPRVNTLLTQEMFNTSGQSSGFGHTSRVVPTVQRKDVQTYSTPIDNIPFTNSLNNGNELLDNNSMSVLKCLETIDRIQQYLSTASQSEYSFHLENNILSESLLS